MTIGIDLGAVWSYYCTPNEGGEVVPGAICTVIGRATR